MYQKNRFTHMPTRTRAHTHTDTQNLYKMLQSIEKRGEKSVNYVTI